MIYEAPYTPILGIKISPKVSKKTNPGKSHGKPPNKINLANSNNTKQLERIRLCIKILGLNLRIFIAAKGAINAADNNNPINIIIDIDIVIFVFP